MSPVSEGRLRTSPRNPESWCLSPPRRAIQKPGASPFARSQKCGVAPLAAPRPRHAQLPGQVFPATGGPPGLHATICVGGPSGLICIRRGSTNGLRGGFDTRCCQLRARVCACVTAAEAVAVAVAVGGGPGGPQRAGTGPGARFPSASRPRGPAESRDHPYPAGRSRDVGGGPEETVPQSQPGRGR